MLNKLIIVFVSLFALAGFSKELKFGYQTYTDDNPENTAYLFSYENEFKKEIICVLEVLDAEDKKISYFEIVAAKEGGDQMLLVGKSSGGHAAAGASSLTWSSNFDELFTALDVGDGYTGESVMAGSKAKIDRSIQIGQANVKAETTLKSGVASKVKVEDGHTLEATCGVAPYDQ